MQGTTLLIKRRLLAVLIIFTILVNLLLVRLIWIQVVKAEWYQQEAYKQQTWGMDISPRRGTIYDRNGKELAVSATVDTVTVNPQEIKGTTKDKALIAQRQENVANKLAEILGMDPAEVLKKVQKVSRYEIIKKRIDDESGNKIRQWLKDSSVHGIYVVEDSKRFYPNKNLAAHVIGFTGEDNQGLDGIEAIMEEYLKGKKGKILSEVDAGGRELPFNVQKRIDPQDGLNVVLTIDETIQYFAEKELEKAIADDKVLEGATAIVMDPRNGDILALTSKPDFDLNNPRGAPAGEDPKTWNGYSSEGVKKLQKTVWRDKAVADTYEPGSTFKAITSAAGLEENVIQPDSQVNDFTVTVGGWPFNCWRPNAHGNETFREGVYNSCNPVFVRVAQSLGIDRFYKYVRAFGFNERTKVDLPGEAIGVKHAKPSEVDMAAASFGQRFTITPIQLITAYTAIANGGSLMKPRLVKELTDDQGNVVKRFEPEVVRNVISKKTSDTLKDILEGVVSEGTGSNAYIPGYRVAGKTGTSETKETKETGRYIASFSSFAPADNPVICVLVVLDHPDVYPHGGGVLAAPVAGKIIESTLNYLDVERRYTEKDKQLISKEVFVPDVRNMSIAKAAQELNKYGLVYKVEGDGNNKDAVVVEQTPKQNASVPENSTVILYTYKPDQEIRVKMPDVRNKTIDEATLALRNAGLNIKIDGMGISITQQFEPGTELPKGKVVEVVFRQRDME